MSGELNKRPESEAQKAKIDDSMKRVETADDDEGKNDENDDENRRWATNQDIYDFMKQQHIKDGRTSPIPDFEDCFKSSDEKYESKKAKLDTSVSIQDATEITNQVGDIKVNFEIVNSSKSWKHIQKLDVSTSVKSSVTSMRAMLAKLALVPMTKLRLVHDGITLLDDYDIGHYNIKENDKVYMFTDGEKLETGLLSAALASTSAAATTPTLTSTITSTCTDTTTTTTTGIVDAAVHTDPFISASVSPSTNAAISASTGTTAAVEVKTATSDKQIHDVKSNANSRVYEVKTSDRVYRWSIANFSKYLAGEPGRYIRGSPFLMGGHSWQLKLYAGGSWSKVGAMSLFLECLSPPASCRARM